ncbi:hypothetical protein ACIRRH_08760 [Kitasatospora sp. NPDC101235]|uniref:hypothetical protein n=1 Tax=Kitasatospora sp. NPDC101235 TaxID=3364101 RepID=UPI0038265ED5
MARMRMRFNPWPDPVIELADTADPKCPDCDGVGEWAEEFTDDGGEDGGFEYLHCACWDPGRVRRLLPVPRWIARALFGWTPPTYSTEPPF